MLSLDQSFAPTLVLFDQASPGPQANLGLKIPCQAESVPCGNQGAH